MSPMSALPPKAYIGTQSRNVRFVPEADIFIASIIIGSLADLMVRFSAAVGLILIMTVSILGREATLVQSA